MAYVDFADSTYGEKERKRFWLSKQGIDLLSGWRSNGVTVAEMVEKYIGVSMTTYRNWLKESDELREAMNRSKEVADSAVENALFKRACGYDWWEETHELLEGELRLVRKIKRHVSPDTKAIMQWLFSRLPNKWRAQQEPLENTEYKETIREILVAMKEVAETGDGKTVEVKDSVEG